MNGPQQGTNLFSGKGRKSPKSFILKEYDSCFSQQNTGADGIVPHCEDKTGRFPDFGGIWNKKYLLVFIHKQRYNVNKI